MTYLTNNPYLNNEKLPRSLYMPVKLENAFHVQGAILFIHYFPSLYKQNNQLSERLSNQQRILKNYKRMYCRFKLLKKRVVSVIR